METISAEVVAEQAEEKSCNTLSLKVWAATLVHTKVYLDGFIGVIQGGREELTQMMRNLFRTIYDISQSKEIQYIT